MAQFPIYHFVKRIQHVDEYLSYGGTTSPYWQDRGTIALPYAVNTDYAILQGIGGPGGHHEGGSASVGSDYTHGLKFYDSQSVTVRGYASSLPRTWHIKFEVIEFWQWALRGPVERVETSVTGTVAGQFSDQSLAVTPFHNQVKGQIVFPYTSGQYWEGQGGVSQQYQLEPIITANDAVTIAVYSTATYPVIFQRFEFR